MIKSIFKSLRIVFILGLLLYLTLLSRSISTESALPLQEKTFETITYGIIPAGTSVFKELGVAEFRGKKFNLTSFTTNVAGFKDTEKIYSDLKTGMPAWVERDIEIWFHKEYLLEEYLLQDNSLTITKYEKGKKTGEYRFKGSGPINNAVILPFSLRSVADLKIGWSTTVRFPDEFLVKITGIEQVKVPAGEFKAYHFTSTPNKFEIWITADESRIPVKIKGCGGVPYTMVMKSRSIAKERKGF